jgi:FkbM family methyltransferase
MVLEHSLGLEGQYAGLYGEVVDKDTYHVRDVADIVSINDPNYVHEKGHKGIDFVPDVVLDLGANVGVFSRYARSLWPDASIVAVEPNPWNQSVFEEFTKDPNIILLKNAIGKGQMYYAKGANGAMEVYLSQGLGFNKLAFQRLNEKGTTVTSSVTGIMLTDLKKYCKGKVLLKLDIEGNESVIFNDPASMELMKTFEYICMELHFFAYDGQELEKVKAKTKEALDSLNETHETRYDHIYFYATKK